ncbi:MAG: peroxidase family protein [Pseudobdellovibrionaceae bacterium]
MQNIKATRNTDTMPEVHFDLAAVDIVRDRERLVPRYNEFRRQLGLKPIKTFGDLTREPKDVKLLNDIYGGDVEKLDLVVGTLAENDRYEGFAFSNTPFYIFLLMASRRLMSDPFFSDYFVPEVYTTEGIDWVNKVWMIDVIKRHYPELARQFEGVRSAFHPWKH